MDARRKVDITIDELVLHGFSPADREAIGAAFSLELERLAAEFGASTPAGVDIPSLRAQTTIPRAGAGPAVIGAQVAKAVHGAIPK